MLPAIMWLSASSQKTISALVSSCSLRFSVSDRINNFATEKSKALIAKYSDDTAVFVNLLGFDDVAVTDVDTTDGLRITLSDENIIHLRPSSNAPELRCYAESTSDGLANSLVVKVLTKVVTL